MNYIIYTTYHIMLITKDFHMKKLNIHLYIFWGGGGGAVLDFTRSKMVNKCSLLCSCFIDMTFLNAPNGRS